MLTVDRAMYKRDGICIAVCPADIIEFKEKDAFPSLIDGGDEICIKCGHCVAACPHAAMAHVIMKPDDCPSISDDRLPSPEQVAYFLRARRSIRQYEEKDVGRDVLTKLIDVARFAPSGHNLQPVDWLVIYDGN